MYLAYLHTYIDTCKNQDIHSVDLDLAIESTKNVNNVGVLGHHERPPPAAPTWEGRPPGVAPHRVPSLRAVGETNLGQKNAVRAPESARECDRECFSGTPEIASNARADILSLVR